MSLPQTLAAETGNTPSQSPAPAPAAADSSTPAASGLHRRAPAPAHNSASVGTAGRM